MPDPPVTSEQIDNLTTSQDGTGRVSRLQPKSHFFIKGGNQLGDFTQTPNQSFGVLSTTQFNTTATVSFSGDKDIYSLCMGTVFLQPGGTGLINLILRPFKQPINGLNIKYIVYRGLKKSDFITSAGKLAGSETSGSGFAKNVWGQFNKFYDVANGGTPPEFNSYFLGFPHTADELTLQEDSQLIDQYFFNIATFTEGEEPDEVPVTAFDLPVIPRGLHLGTASGSVGIDVVLNDGDYYIENDTHPFKLNLAYARASAYVLDTASETDNFKKKLIKETATKFIDIAAFYGLHANGAGKLYVDEIIDPLEDKADIALRLQNFNTKNNFYLYIQANRQRSYNFYNNYDYSDSNANSINIGVAADSLQETAYGTGGWPIHVVNMAQDPATENNTITFQLTTDNYDGAALFMQIGELASPQEENFVRGVNLLQQQPEDDTVVIDTNYTQALQISTPAIGENTIAAFAQCIYEGQKLEVVDSTTPDQIYYLKDIDDVFGLLNAQSLFVVANENQLPTVISEKLQIINFPNAASAKDIGAVKYQRIEDRLQTVDENTYINRVTYESLLNTIKRNTSPYLKNASATTDSVKANIKTYETGQNVFYQPKPPYRLTTELFTDDNQTITGLILEVTDGSIPTKKILGITKVENDQLKALINGNMTNPKLYFKDKGSLNSLDGTQFKIYSLSVIAESNDGNLTIYTPTEEIIVYNANSFVYASDDYSKYIPKEIGELTIDFTL